MNAAILLLHGALGSKDQLKGLQLHVGGHAIDLAGHGDRVIPENGLTFEHFIDDIDGFFNQEGLTEAHLFGYSMGGYAALLYASRFPHRVRSVTTLGTILVWSEEGLQKELRKLDPHAMEAKVPAFVRNLANAHGADRWKRVVAAVAKSMNDLAAYPLLTDEVIARIECPVLVCVGDGDTSAGLDNTRSFAAVLPRSEVLVLPSTRHPFEEVDLDFLVPRLKTFWERVDER
ncbi:MAG: alpha/beta fold hydrolase [Flavobacteriales bacterium]|nr:alpha/beta fold hydrolase [Flavobacteriales bacterium]